MRKEDTPKSLAQELFEDRNIFLCGEINGASAMETIASLLVLDGASNEPINLYIFSGGGEIYSGLAIIDTIKSIQAPVYAYCLGLCASMAANIFATADKRYMGANSRFMIHQPLGGMQGKASDMQTTIDEIMYLKEQTSQILSDNSKLSTKDILKMIEKDKFLNANECLELGFCDEIIKTKNTKNEGE